MFFLKLKSPNISEWSLNECLDNWQIFNFTANNPQPRFMDINKQPLTIHEIKLLVKAKQEQYQEAIKNNVSFNKLKAMHESINELKMLLQKRKGK